MRRQRAVGFSIGSGNLSTGKVEGAVQAHVHDSGYTTFNIVGACRFIDVHTLQQLGGNVLQGDEAARGSEYLAAVQQSFDVRKAADQQLGRLGGIAADLHAGYVLQGFDDVIVRQFSDVFRNDRIPDLIRIPLVIERRLDAGANAGDYNLGKCVVRLCSIPGIGFCDRRSCR